jgi:pilus assembly protein CpaB
VSQAAVLRFGWRRSWLPPHLRRRLLAGLLAAAGVIIAASSLGHTASGVSVAVAAHDLAAGSRLNAGDITVVSLPTGAVPAGTQASAGALVGQTLTGPVRAREPLTDLRLTAAPGVAGLAAGLVAAPVRLADPDVAPLLHPGSRVDVLAAVDAAGAPGGTSKATASLATIVARDVEVLAVSSTSEAKASVAGGTLVVLAVTRSDAQTLAGGEANGKLSVTLLG